MKLKTILPSLLTLLLGLGVAARVTLPNAQNRAAERADAQTRVTALEAEVSQLPTERARETALKADHARLQATLPDAEALPSVLNTFSSAARALNVQLGPIKRTVKASTVPGVTAVDLEVALTGTYPRVQALVQTLGQLDRAYTTQGVTVGVDDAALVKAALKVTTYTRDATPPAAPAQPVASVTPTTGATP